LAVGAVLEEPEELEPGEYVMVCFVSVGGAEDGPPHFTQGMKYEFTVEDA
jgi:hypothetical protein